MAGTGVHHAFRFFRTTPITGSRLIISSTDAQGSDPNARPCASWDDFLERQTSQASSLIGEFQGALGRWNQVLAVATERKPVAGRENETGEEDASFQAERRRDERPVHLCVVLGTGGKPDGPW